MKRISGLQRRTSTLLVVLVLGLLLTPRPAWAAPTIASVQPSSVSSANSATLVVTGAGFTSGAVVVVEGYGALSTTFVSATVLTAVLPAGIPAGMYGITVVLSDASSATLPNALTVTGPTPTPAPTGTPAPTAFVRPLLVVQSYGASSVEIPPGVDLDFEMTLLNAGQGDAANIVATFPSGDFVPRVTGGVRAVGTLSPGQTARFFQPLASSSSLAGKSIATLDVKVSYTDPVGTVYNESFTLTFAVAQPQRSGPAATATPTPTARPVLRPQLLVASYSIDVSQLQPGGRFTLNLDIRNVGNANAKRVTAIVGGGTSAGTTTGASGTAQPGGGVSGASGEFTNFAPLNSSNVQYLGDLNTGGSVSAQQVLIVNASTKPGAYTLKLSFSYTDDKNNAFTDDQVITLLVYQPPLLDISFYRDPGPLFAGQPNSLPLQVVNLGRTATVLGNMKVTAPQGGAQFSNNVALVGNLDIGFPFTLDAICIPDQPGPLELTLTVDYTDDFNQPQTITKTLTVEVVEGGGPVVGPEGPGGSEDPGVPGEGGTPSAPETLWQKVLRVFLGLIGLDSGQPGGSTQPPAEVAPPTEVPVRLPPKG